MPPKKESTTIAAAATIASSTSNLGAAEIAAAEQKQALYKANTKLCRLVKRCPWMYDRQHPNYAKKQIMDKSWAKIAKDCDDSVASCKERWRNMRAAFARSINIYKTNSGPNRVKPYYLHNELKFLITPMMEGRESKELDYIKTDLDDSNIAPPEAEDSTSAQMPAANFDTAATTAAAIAQPSDVLSDIDTDFDFPDIEQTHSPAIEEPNSDAGNEGANTTATNLEATKANEQNCHAIAEATVMPETYAVKRQKLSHEMPSTIFTQQQQQQHYHHSINGNSSCSNNFLSTTADVDAKFLEALLPDMRAMNARQKIVFKRKIYQSLEEVFETSSDFPLNNNNNNNISNNIAATTGGVVTVTANSSAAQNVLRSIASLKENEMHKLQEYLQTIYRQRDGVGGNVQQVNGQAVTVIPRAQQQLQQQQRIVGLTTQANSSAFCNGRTPQLQPISIKYELLDDDDDDFE